ncbi:MAG TPA: PEP-utilizing enzyme [Acidimicrobiales bacterium]|nr:PEP-utilizing enzyme [Acidimicrobiales bacterium]
MFPQPSREGFADGTAPFGLLLDHLEWAFVAGWGYLSPRPVPALRDAGRLTRAAWDDLVESSAGLQARLAVSARVFEDRAWRHDLTLWDDQLKPALVARHLRVQEVDPVDLSGADLLAHLARCRDNLRSAIWTHHRFNVTPVLPVGELLARCRDWTDATAVDVLGLLRGAGPLAVGASDELAWAADAIRADPSSASEVGGSGSSDDVLATLVGRPGQVGQATARYLDLVGNWSAGHGFDIDEPTLMEMPDLVVESLRVAVAEDPRAQAGDDATERAVQVRSAVPRAHRSEFDQVLGEARLVHRLRDERALYCDVWANGLMRRAIVAAGARVAGQGLIDDAGHLVEATWDEMRSLLADDGLSPSALEAAADLAARAAYRSTADPSTVAPVLGQSSRSPVPTEWLTPGAARTEAAFRTYLAAMDADDDDDAGSTATLRGVGASPGVFEGPARVVHGAAGIGNIRDGDVLVTGATSPAFNIVLPLIGAIVTDQGGMLSHAAIVAREYAIPAVVGTETATRQITDGARLRVDGVAGEVTVVAP